jgi:hypothetical protein
MVHRYQREFTRLPISMHATLIAGERTIFCPETRGVSLRGLYAYSSDSFRNGTEVEIVLRFGGDGALSIDLQGHVVDSDQGGMGIEFTAMSVEALHQMRTLLLHNAADPDQLQREFQQHVDSKRSR